ncbi:hypothetical protein GQ607_014648 [Colletotrichum asianum]|uniref:Uncharacterized protein n=1 Tax=Colletotrichum asianum TaxID=702518 RepID=A0A8H3W2K9_9PEZI|nr:hypothetical protein GQ607_014648 [Colletotrichum asianum]
MSTGPVSIFVSTRGSEFLDKCHTPAVPSPASA